MKIKILKRDIRLTPGYLVLILWLAFTVVAVGWLILASLSTTREIFTNTLLKSGFHFDNYLRAIKEQNLGRYFINTVIYTTVACVGTIIVAAPAAYVLGRLEFRGKKLVNTMFISAMSVPAILLIIPLFSVFSKIHLTGSIFTLIIIYICISVPFTVFFLASFFSTIPGVLEEAGLIDGCSVFSVFWKIILPLAQPGIITVTVFNFLTIWNEYFWALLFANKVETRTLALGLQSMVQAMRFTGDWAGLFASVVVVFVPTFIVYIALSEKIIAGVTAGSVKG